MSLRYLSMRLLHSALVIIGVLLLVFILTHLLGDPVRIVLPPTASQAQVERVREQLHLNDPILVQLRDFILSAANGSFGNSFWQRVPAMPLVLGRLPATLYLALVSFALTVPIGISMGVLAALRPGSLLERSLNVLSLVSVSIVDFWLALMLILLFSVTLRLLPTSGFGGVDHVLLPAVTMTVLGVGSLAQITRASVAEELGRSYVSAARARGISEFRVITRHALRNALIPIVTIGGSILTSIIGGVIIVEFVFGWPGLGQLFAQALQKRDLPLIEACILVTAVMVVSINLLTDVAYAIVNPRVRFS